MFLSKEDYQEPCCPLSKPTSVTSIPIRRVIEKLDEYLGRNDYESAQSHLCYWIKEAELGNDTYGKLSVLNEQIGLYRKLSKKDEGLKAISDTLELLEVLDMGGTATLGTTYINIATAYKAFGEAKTALPYYEKAMDIYEAALDKNDRRFAGLYNNMAITVMELGDYNRAEDLFNEAIKIMSEQENGQPETAVTYCNLADLAAAKYGMENAEEKISECLNKAEALLNTEGLSRDGNYAFVCEKCASTFGYYGYFLVEQELLKRAGEIYERT